MSQVRNLSRLIWINVAVPPADDSSKGKSSAATLTAKELRRQKVQAMKLCVCFTFAVKHYLRGEDGLDWDDYIGILPPSVTRLARPSTSRRSSGWTSYAATAKTSGTDSGTASRDEQDVEGTTSESGPEIRRENADATKRIRVKRSKDRLKQGGVRNSRTPLLSALHQTIDFNPNPENLSTPLPLV